MKHQSLNVCSSCQHLFILVFFRSTFCLELNADNIGLFHKECTRFLTDRCHLYSNETDFALINRTLDTIMTSTNVAMKKLGNEIEGCGDVLFGLACKSVYLGCDPDTQTPIRLCEETCLEYLTLENCSQSFANVVDTLNENEDGIGLKIDLNCSVDSFFTNTNEFTFIADTGNKCFKGKT